MSRIPNVFHFVFGLRSQRECFHLVHYLCIGSCVAVNRPSRVVFHCQHEPWGPYWDRVRPMVEVRRIARDSVVEGYRYRNPGLAQFRYAHHADVARLDILLEEGGIYADIDTIFVAPLPRHFFSRSCILGRERANWRNPAIRRAGGALCNAWIMAEPGAPFVRLWRERLHDHFDGSWNAHSIALPYRISCELPDLVHVEPERSFFHLDWTRAGLRALFERNVTLPPGVYSVHLWSHLWWTGRAISFRAERLTPAYVRHANSTYSNLARAHLPADIEGQDAAAWRAERRRARVEDVWWRACDVTRTIAQVFKKSAARRKRQACA